MDKHKEKLDQSQDIVTGNGYVCSSKSNQNVYGPCNKLIKRKTNIILKLKVALCTLRVGLDLVEYDFTGSRSRLC